MMLSDKLYEESKKLIGNTDLKSEEEFMVELKKIIDLCLNEISSLKNDKYLTNEKIINTEKRVCNTWDMVAKKLIKEGSAVLKVNGFKDYIENHNISFEKRCEESML